MYLFFFFFSFLKGYEHKLVSGTCCGECVRTSCVAMINNITEIIPVRPLCLYGFTPVK